MTIVISSYFCTLMSRTDMFLQTIFTSFFSSIWWIICPNLKITNIQNDYRGFIRFLSLHKRTFLCLPLICVFNWDFCPNLKSHKEHACGLFFSCTSITCRFTWLFDLNSLSHMEHLTDFIFPSWSSRTWACIVFLYGKLFWQIGHSCVIPSWIELTCSFK